MSISNWSLSTEQRSGCNTIIRHEHILAECHHRLLYDTQARPRRRPRVCSEPIAIEGVTSVRFTDDRRSRSKTRAIGKTKPHRRSGPPDCNCRGPWYRESAAACFWQHTIHRPRTSWVPSCILTWGFCGVKTVPSALNKMLVLYIKYRSHPLLVFIVSRKPVRCKFPSGLNAEQSEHVVSVDG